MTNSMNRISVTQYNNVLKRLKDARFDLEKAEEDFAKSEKCSITQNCCICNGLGEVSNIKCKNCNGKGYIE